MIENLPAKAIEPMPDQKTAPSLYHEIILFLGTALLIGMISIGVLAGIGKEVPQGLIALASSIGGALGGALVVTNASTTK